MKIGTCVMIYRLWNPDYITSILYDQQGYRNFFKSLVQLGISDPRIIRRVAQLFISQKRYDDALIILQGMLQGAPEYVELHYLAGITFKEQERFEQAINHVEQALKYAPDNPGIQALAKFIV